MALVRGNDFGRDTVIKLTIGIAVLLCVVGCGKKPEPSW